jgi:hypothetical protein
MAVNRYLHHLVVILEDEPYRDIMNGIKNSATVNDLLIDVKTPVGGWTKVFASLDDQNGLLNKFSNMHLLLLIDFDREFSRRYEMFRSKINAQPYQNRVFLLGVYDKQSEDLKRALGHINLEALGKDLVDNCPQQQNIIWQNEHLVCNQAELSRMQQAGVFKWLFRD